jgi:hypothetical protein
MKTAAFNADGSRNGFVPLDIGPLNRSEQSRFGRLDVAIIAVFLLVTATVLGLVLSLALS